MRSKLGILLLTFVVGAVHSIHDPSYTGVKTKTYQRDPQIAQALQQQQQQQQHEHEQHERRFRANQYQHPTNYHSVNGDVFKRLSSQSSSSTPGVLTENSQQQKQHPLQTEQQYYIQDVHRIIHQETPIYERYATIVKSPSLSASTSSSSSSSALSSSQPSSLITGSGSGSSSNWDDAENAITEYYTGCPKGFTGQLPYLYDCRRFLNCWNGRGHIQSCAPGTVFNPDTLECDRPDKVLCGTLGTTSAHFSHIGRDDDRSGRLLDAHTENVPALCPHGVTGLHPHPTDCTKYLNCANGNVHIQSCGPGTAYSIPMMVCDFEEKVECSGREGSEAIGSNGPISAQNQLTYGSHSKDSTENVDIFCPDGVTGLFPYPFDHGKFMNCKHGNTAIQNCIPGTIFSISKRFCGPQNKIAALDRVNSLISDSHYDYSQSVVTCPPGMYGLYLYPYDCSKYLNCLSDHKMELRSCAPGMIYSYAERHCVWEQQTGATARVAKYDGAVDTSYSHVINSHAHSAPPPPSYSAENAILVTCPTDGSGLHPYPFDCSRYLRCQNGKIFVEVCEAGAVFSLATKNCQLKEQVDANERVAYLPESFQHHNQHQHQFVTVHSPETLLPPIDSSSCPPGVEGLFLHPFDCTAYLRCSRGKKSVEHCPSGNVFSISRQMCLERNQVSTSDRVAFSSSHHVSSHSQPPALVYDSSAHTQWQPAASSDRRDAFVGGTQQWNSHSHSTNGGSESHGYNFSFKEAHKRDEEVTCPPGANGLLPHPNDCAKFLNCMNGITHVQHCGPDTAWNQAMKVCTLVDQADCAATHRLSASTSSDLKGFVKSTSKVIETQQSQMQQAHYDHSSVACTPGRDGVFPHPFDCTKYLNCREGDMIIESCITGTAFSISTRSCELRETIQKSDRVPFLHEYGHDRPPDDTERTKERSHTTVDYDTNQISCPPGAFGLHLHPFERSKYLRCEGGQIMVHTCTDGRVFSLSRKYCVDRNEVSRNDRVEYLSEAKNPVNSPAGREANALFECTPDFNGILPHSSDCTKFVTCANGVAYIRDCAPGTAWNIQLEVCDYEDKVDCSGRNQEKGSHHEVKIECPKGASGVQPHPNDCKKFLNCANGVTHIQDCGPGTAWNRAMEVCDFENNVDCGQTEESYSHRGSKQYEDSHTNTPYHSPSVPPNKWQPLAHHHSSPSSPAVPPTPQQHYPTPNRDDSHSDPSNHYNHHQPDHQGRWAGMGMSRPSVPQGPKGTSEFQSHSVVSSDNGQRSLDIDWNDNLGLNTKPSEHSTTRTRLEGRGFQTHEQEPNQGIEGNIQPNPANYPKTDHQYAVPLAPFLKSVTTTSTSTTTASPTSTSFSTNIHYAEQIDSEENSSDLFDNIYGGDLSPVKSAVSTANKNDNSPRALPHAGRPYNESSDIAFTTPIRPPPPLNLYQSAESDPSDLKSYVGSLQPPNPTPTHSATTPEGFLKPPVDPTVPLSPSGRQLEEEATEARVYRIYPSVRNDSVVKFHGDPHYSPSYAGVSHNARNAIDLGRKFIPPSQLESSSTSTITLRSDEVRSHLHPKEIVVTNYNRQYYKPVTLTAPKPDTELTDPDMEKLPLSDALHMLLRPYLNRNGTISEDSAARAESHIMHLAAGTTTTTPTPTPSVTKSTTSRTRNQADHQRQDAVSVELIFTDEQRSLLGRHEKKDTQGTRTPDFHPPSSLPPNSRDLKESSQGLERKTTWHNEEFHASHPHLPNPFRAGERGASPDPSIPPDNVPWPLHNHHHDHHQTHHQEHSRNFHLNNPNNLNLHEITTPIKPIEGTSWNGFYTRLNDKDQSCSFDCGNSNCLKDYEVCDGVFNCENHKDEAQCDHLGYEVRLAGGENSNSGRVEVKILGKWGYVCDDQFGLLDADVVCKELGFNLGASEVRGNSFYPPPDANLSFVMDEVECKGNEHKLRECNFKGWGVNNCGPDEVVGVVCKVPLLKCPNNYWLCSESKECIPPAFVCDNTPDCSDRSDESERVCNSPIEYRLEGGRGINEGRVEVMYRGEWGSVCDDDFGETEAQVLCNSLGFYGTPKIERNIFGPGSGPIWLDQVSCVGNESSIDKCNHWTWGEHNCNHTEDVGIRCTAGPPPRQRSSTRLVVKSGHERGEKQRTLQDDVATLEDIGLYTGQLQRSSKLTIRHSNPKRCGHFKPNLYDEYEHPEERVLNGTTAKRGHHPWQATIRTKGRGGISSHWCGAVLISKKHLLTAAHCLVGYPKGAYFIRMGDHYANIAESSETDSYIENWYIHEKFRDKTHMNNDIALIVLKNPVRFNDYIQPICLPEKRASLRVNRLCTISGWGSIKSGVSTPSNILRAAQLPILSDETCQQAHVYGNSMTEGMFCAGSMDESVDACDGDSGGPLVCSDEDGETLYGIISWGQQCGFANKPGVYVRVEKYIDWIYEKINFSLQNTGH